MVLPICEDNTNAFALQNQKAVSAYWYVFWHGKTGSCGKNISGNVKMIADTNNPAWTK